MPHEPTLAELREKKKKNDAYITKISQCTHALGDTIRAQEKNLKMFDRKERTHRLCTRGGMLESFLHDASALTDEQVMELLRVCFRQNPVKDALNKMLEDAYSGKVYHYLMKVNGGIQADAAALQAESERLKAHRTKLQKKLEPMKPILNNLHFVKRCVDDVEKDQEPPSIMEQLEAVRQQAEAQSQAQQEEEQRKQYEQNKAKRNKTNNGYTL